MSYATGLGQNAAQQSLTTETSLKTPSFPPVLGFGIPPFWISIPVTKENTVSIVLYGLVIGTLFYAGKRFLSMSKKT